MKFMAVRRRPAFTLVELVLTTAIVGILMAGLSSAVVLATRALPNEDRNSSRVLEQRRWTDGLLADLEYAWHITERGANAITFTVADRNGDGSPECLRYAWTGKAGDPLTLEYNHAAATTVLENVQQFDLSYDLRSVTETYTGLPVEGAELSLVSYPLPLGGSDFTVDDKAWIGQYLAPTAGSLPVGCLTWRLTRVLFTAKTDGPTDATLGAQIRDWDPNYKPMTTVLEEALIPESTLSSSYAWCEAAYKSVAGLKPGQAVCLVLRRAAGPGNAAKIRFDQNAGAGRVTTTNAGGNWTYDASKSMLYYAYGKATTAGPAQTAKRQFVTGVRVALRAGADSAARLDTLVRTMNVPEVLAAVWELDFSTDPTAVDMNADAAPDWVAVDDAPFTPGSLSGGVWTADRALDTDPANDFTQLTTAEVRFQDTTTTGGGAGIWLHVDRAGATYGVIYAEIAKQIDGTQMLTVYTKADAGSATQLSRTASLAAGFVSLRLLVDPALDSVNVRVNDQDRGTFSYPRYTDNKRRLIELYPVGNDAGAQFDWVRIRVGGNS
jgi:prepilin-type N-terminal cleavage/methylation domain-containing protein